jgi:hypothetical protein
MKTWTLRLSMSLMVVAAFWANRLPAQEPVVIVPPSPYEPARHPYFPPAITIPERPPVPSHPIHRFMHNHGINCGLVYPYAACSNLHYETRYVFGSCRWFFNETCPPNSSNGLKNASCGSKNASCGTNR